MARIIVDIPSISGASTLTGYEEKIEAVAIFDVVESAIAGGTPKLSEVALTRYRDRATPAICQAACLGTDLGDVKIYVLRSVGGTVRPYLTYTLTNTMVSRVEFDTAESNGNAFREHGGYSNAFSGRYKGAPDYVRTSCSGLHTGTGTGFGPLTWRRAAHSDRFGARCTLPTAQSTRSIEQDELGT